MAVPTPPTINSLITEAYRRCGIANPSTAQLLRATDEWLEEVKQEISDAKTWHTAEETMVVIPQPYLQVYAMPSPLVRVQRVRFYRGATKGTAQTGTTSTITVAAGTGSSTWNGRKIFLTSGAGAAQVGRITGVSGGVVAVSCTWDLAPTSSTTYMVADTERFVSGPERGFLMSGINPSTSILKWDFVEQNLRFWPPVDAALEYALEIDGEVDLSLIDNGDARITRLLREWRVPIVRGLMVRIKEDQDDPDVDRDERKYAQAIKSVARKDGRKRQRAEAGIIQGPGGFARRLR